MNYDDAWLDGTPARCEATHTVVLAQPGGGVSRLDVRCARSARLRHGEHSTAVLHERRVFYVRWSETAVVDTLPPVERRIVL